MWGYPVFCGMAARGGGMDTIAAIATGMTESGIGIVRISGVGIAVKNFGVTL